jgi:hypothetical protein
MANKLSFYFDGIAAKRISDVEIKTEASNQHEFNGINELKAILGPEKSIFKGMFLLIGDDENKIIKADGSLTWYDAREKTPNRTEYRLYYSTNEVINNANPNDLLIILKTKKQELLVLIIPFGTTMERQLLWLFGISEVGNKFFISNFEERDIDLNFTSKWVIESLGIGIEDESSDYLPLILEKYGAQYPSTKEFSQFARSTITDISPKDDPDETLIKWMEREELLFKTLEKHLVEYKLKAGFGKEGIDVEDFLTFSIGVQNRRKSRAGYAFENHLSIIFEQNGVNYSRTKVTELNKKPDFLFPGIAQYRDSTFSPELLTMLGVKTTLKDRWRQIINEANRINRKHLITLEPALSKNQTDEIRSENVQLVIPKSIIGSFSEEQKHELIDLKTFIMIVQFNQKKVKLP